MLHNPAKENVKLQLALGLFDLAPQLPLISAAMLLRRSDGPNLLRAARRVRKPATPTSFFTVVFSLLRSGFAGPRRRGVGGRGLAMTRGRGKIVAGSTPVLLRATKRGATRRSSKMTKAPPACRT